MKPYRILKGFPGSQTGLDSTIFTAGTVADLSDDLAAIVVAEGWAELDTDDFSKPAEELRETKVTRPEETKPTKLSLRRK